MKKLAAAITMVKDDYFFLKKWVDYYGGLFGKQSLYIFNHGGDPKIDRIAEGCNVMYLPPGFDETFDAKRWRLLNNFTNGLRNYYRFVICGDVDEFIVPDPKLKLDLADFLAKRQGRVLITPIGLEVIHRREVETQSVEKSILGPRLHCRFSTYFCKPCVIGKPVDLARGGHYAMDPKLLLFRNLYLFHMKYADYNIYTGTLKRRVTQVEAIEGHDKDASDLSAHWFLEPGAEGAELDKLANLPLRDRFDFSDRLKEMDQTWEPRGEDGLWHFRKHVGQELFPIPERFSGII
ncbi:MAG: hypothetical protein GY947_17060 [Rhodobacteraceae bacterium]|nr:hypothetical protein [Paracoccaceae bacterium]